MGTRMRENPSLILAGPSIPEKMSILQFALVGLVRRARFVELREKDKKLKIYGNRYTPARPGRHGMHASGFIFSRDEAGDAEIEVYMAG